MLSSSCRGVTPIVALRPVGDPVNPRMPRSAARRSRMVARCPSAALGRAFAGHNATIRGTYRSGCLLLRIVALRPTEGRTDAIRRISAVEWPRSVAACPAIGVAASFGGHNATIRGTHRSGCLLLRIVALRPTAGRTGPTQRASAVKRPRSVATCPAISVAASFGGHNATICGTHGSDRRAQDHHGTSRARRSSSVSRRRLSLTCPRSITACAGRSRPL